MQYSALKTAVANYLHRSDLTSNIVDFIEYARVRIGSELRSTANQTAATVTSFSAGRAALPSNLSALIAVWQDDYPLIWAPMDIVDTASSGVYSVDGGDLVVPGAGSTDVVNLSYWTIPAALVNNTDVSEGMNEFPQLWIYAACYEAALYLRDLELAAAMDAAYQTVLASANRAGRDARFSKQIYMTDVAANITASGPGL